MAIPEEGYFDPERGRYGPVFPRTPACQGFSITAKVKEGREGVVPAYGRTIEETQGIFDTDFDKYTEDAVQLFSATASRRCSRIWRASSRIGKNPEAFINFVREHQVPSFLEYGEFPYVTADEIKKALRLKAAFSNMLDQMQ
jgi:hypothetical protein